MALSILDVSAGWSVLRHHQNAGVAVAARTDVADCPIAYETSRGVMYRSTIEDFLESDISKSLQGKVQLIFTSPPFPLNRKKRYGNLQGDDFVKWLSELAPSLVDLLRPKGSIVVEMGNAWEPGRPVMSVLALQALLAFLKQGELNLCQQFVCFNPARLPSPAQWVNVERIRVKDSYTNVWWMSPSERPKASNKRVLVDYSPSMKKLLRTRRYNPGRRPSGHNIGEASFFRNNGGAIPPNVLTLSNTASNDPYVSYCKKRHLIPHPARMPAGLADFFVRMLTDRNQIVLDPFAGSNTTGHVAETLERRWISVEPSREYIAGSRGRFQDLA